MGRPRTNHDDTSTFTIILPRNLRERARQAAKRLRTETSKIVREALAEKLDEIEAEFAREDQREQQKRETKLARKPQPLVVPGALAPKPFNTEEPRQSNPSLNSLLQAHAKKIAGANEPYARRLYEREAITEIQKHYDLQDETILEEIERRVEKPKRESPINQEAPTTATEIISSLERIFGHNDPRGEDV